MLQGFVASDFHPPSKGPAMTSRRSFLQLIPAAGAAFAATRAAAQTPPLLDEKSPQATALGYVHDTKLADKAKYPKHTPDQHCAACQLFQGKAGAATGPCAIFPGKSVQSGGWCSAFVKKTG
jgi:hypothetical protein